MPKYPYGKRSADLLFQTNDRLPELFLLVSDLMNTTILPSTIRTKEQQAEFVKSGVSKTMNSKHLTRDAVDAAPWPVDWRVDKALWKAFEKNDIKEAKEIVENIKRWYEFVGIIKGIAHAKKIPIRHGRDFKGFVDLPHTELKE